MNWLPYLKEGIGGTLKLMSDSIDRNLIEIERLQRQIEGLKREVKSSIIKAEEVVNQHWSKEEIENAKKHANMISKEKIIKKPKHKL